MHTLKLNVQDSVYDKIYNFLSNLPTNEIEIIEDKQIQDDWSCLEKEIDKGFESGVCSKSHEDIISDIKRKYA